MNIKQYIQQEIKHHPGRTIAGALITVFVIALIFGVVEQKKGGDSYASTMGGGMAVFNQAMGMGDYVESAPIMDMDTRAKYVSDDYYPEETEAEYNADVPRQLIKNGSLSITVTNIRDARSQIGLLVDSKQGFISDQYFSNTNYYDEYGQKQERGLSGHMTIKVPQESFEMVMSDLRDMALVVTSENSNVQDVTERYVDLETRLENKKREEVQYRDILARARDISDILEVTKYLEQARSEVERLEGQLRFLSNQIKLSTITVYLESEQTLSFGDITWNPGQQFKQSWNNFVQGLVNFADSVIAAIFMVPLFLLYIVVYGGLLYGIYLVARFIYHRVR